MEDNKITTVEEENFDCCAMKPEGAVTIFSRQEWEKVKHQAKSPGREYYRERVKRIKWGTYEPSK